MATFKAEVRTNKRQDGTRNIRIRVTHNRRNAYIPTQLYIVDSDLTRSGNLKTQSIIDTCDNIIKKYRRICNDRAEELENMNVEQVVKLITEHKDGFKLDFIEYGRSFANKLRENNHTGTAVNYDCTLNSFSKFLKSESIDIHDISAKVLERYETWLRTDNGGKPVQGRGVSLYMSGIRKIFNEARQEFNDEEIGIIQIRTYPFAKYKIAPDEATRKRALTISDIKQVILVEIPTTSKREAFARDMFLLSFYLIGMNSADLYECTDIEDYQIKYCRKKTASRRQDKAEFVVKIEPEALSLFEKYKDNTGKHVFKFHQMYADTNTFNQAINKGLKQLGERLNIEDLEFYAARHSWATIARNQVGIDKDTVHEALNHASDKHMRVTDIYIDKDWTQIHKANRQVIDYLFKDIRKIKKFRWKHKKSGINRPFDKHCKDN